MNMTETKGNRRASRLFWLAAALLLLLALSFCFYQIRAKYLTSTSKNDLAVAEEFYFTSDLLDGAAHTVYGDTLKVTLMNHADDLRYSTVNILYNVTVTPGEGVTVSPASDTIVRNAINNSVVTISGLMPGTTYTVTATTNGTYEQTLTGTFTVASTAGSKGCDVVDKGAYLLATVWSVDYAGNYTLSYDTGLIPDQTNPDMSGWAVGPFTVNRSIAKNNSQVYRFFKSADYSGGTVSVTAWS